MIVFISKKIDPLFVEFRVSGLKENKKVLFLWEDDFYKSILFSDVSEIKNEITYYSSINKDLSFFKNNINFKVISITNYEVLFEYKFVRLPFIVGKNINFISQNNSSGYGYAARNYIHQLLTNEYKVDWTISKFYNNSYKSSNEYETKVIDCIDKQTTNNYYDTQILHSTPNDWDKIQGRLTTFSQKTIGSTVWETTRLNSKWVNYINNCDIEQLIVPSNFNVEVFKNSGVKKQIEVWPYDIFPIEYEKLDHINKIIPKFLIYKDGNFVKDDEYIENIFENKTVYYNISQYSERKNIDQTLTCFIKKFKKSDKVCLFVKTFLQQFTLPQIEYLKYKIYTLTKNFENLPDLVFCFEELSDIEIQTIHHNFDIYFTLNRGEGFGLCTYTAKKFGNKVICGKFGAEKEFLESSDILIDYNLVPTFNMHLFHNYYDDNDQMWASFSDSDILKKLEYIPKKTSLIR